MLSHFFKFAGLAIQISLAISLNTFIVSLMESLILIHVALEMYHMVLIDDLDHLIGNTWSFCHLMGVCYSFFGCIIDCSLKYFQLLRLPSKMALNLLEILQVYCGNIGIMYVRSVQPGFGFGRMIYFEFDPDLGSQQSVVNVTELSTLVHSAIHYA